MPDVILSPIGGGAAQFFDNNGRVLAGGKLYSYQAGTTTPMPTFTDSTGTIQNTNPVILDSAGRVSDTEIWILYGYKYKFVLKTSDDVNIGSWDNIPDDIQHQAIASIQTDADGLDSRITSIESGINAVTNCLVNAEVFGSPTITAATTAKIQYSVETVDLGNNFNVGTYEFTAPVTGNYLIQACVFLAPAATPAVGDEVTLLAYKNGTQFRHLDFAEVQVARVSDFFLNGSTIVRLNAAEYIDIRARLTGAVNWTYGGSFCKFNVIRIS